MYGKCYVQQVNKILPGFPCHYFFFLVVVQLVFGDFSSSDEVAICFQDPCEHKHSINTCMYMCHTIIYITCYTKHMHHNELTYTLPYGTGYLAIRARQMAVYIFSRCWLFGDCVHSVRQSLANLSSNTFCDDLLLHVLCCRMRKNLRYDNFNP